MATSNLIKNLVVPVRKQTRRRGTFAFPETATLASLLDADALPLAQLKDELKTAGIRAQLKMGAPEATVLLRRNRALGPEAYRIAVGKDGIQITSATDAGAYYAVQTLIDLVRLGGGELPCGEVEDSPTLRRRGVYHDCARGKVPTVETVKQMIEWLAHWKINELILYIENAFTFEKYPAIGKGYSPYKPQDILAMQAHAKRHHVRFVPSLTSFGHFEKILMAPDLAEFGESPGSRGMPGGTTLSPVHPGSIKLLDDLYGEFLPLFEAEDFVACGDEPYDLGEGRSKQKAQRVGVGRVYTDFIREIRALCYKYGKRMNMWGDIVMKRPEALPDLPKDVCVLNWDYGPENGRVARNDELRDLDLPFIPCPGTNNWASHGSRLHIALENISLSGAAARANGAEGLINTNWGNFGHMSTMAISLCAFAHGAAHAWMTEGVDDAKHVRRFTELVFGDPDGKLASGLSTLGESPIGISQPQYLSMLEKLTASERVSRGGHLWDGFRVRKNLMLDRVTQAHSADKVARRARDVRQITWPESTRPPRPLEALAMDEFKAAAHMEATGCERINLARDIRSGEAVDPNALRKHAEDLDRCAEELERLWRLRNRPSRLRDNLSALRAGAKEARALAARQR